MPLNKNTTAYSTPKQLKLQLDFEKIIDISDPAYGFCEVMDRIDLSKFFADKLLKDRRCIGSVHLRYEPGHSFIHKAVDSFPLGSRVQRQQHGRLRQRNVQADQQRHQALHGDIQGKERPCRRHPDHDLDERR